MLFNTNIQISKPNEPFIIPILNIKLMVSKYNSCLYFVLHDNLLSKLYIDSIITIFIKYIVVCVLFFIDFLRDLKM